MKVQKLKRTPGVVGWCGPMALAVLTGRTLGYCSKKLAQYDTHLRRRVTPINPKNVGGISVSAMQMALGKMGFTYRRITDYGWGRKNATTLFRLAESMSTEHWRAPMLIVTGDHYVVMQRGIIYDSHDPDGVEYRSSPQRHKKAFNIYKIGRK